MRVCNEIEAIKSAMPTLFTLTNTYGQVVSNSFIIKELQKTAAFLNVGKTMNADQILITAELITEGYSNLNLSDFKLFFTNFRKGVYGQLFDRLDGQIIITALARYKSDRMDKGEGLSIDQHEKRKQAEKMEPYTAESATFFKAILSDIEKASEKRRESIEQRRIARNNDYKQSQTARQQRWLNQFENLKHKYPFGENTIRISGMVYTLTSFIDDKLKHYQQWTENK